MATGGYEENADSLQCSVCLESFQQPKALPCSHTFCVPCLTKCVTPTVDENSDEVSATIQCPVCRTVSRLPQGGVSKLRNKPHFLDAADMAARLDDLETKQANTKKKLDGVWLQNQMLLEEQARLKKQDANRERELNRVREMLEGWKDKNAIACQDNQQLRCEVSKVQEDVKALGQKLDDKLNEGLGALRAEQKTLQACVATFTNDQSKLKDDIAALQATKIQDEVTTMKSDLDKLRDDVTAVTSTIDKLRVDVTIQNTIDFKALGQKLDDKLNEGLGALRAEQKTLQACVATFTNDQSKLKDIAALQATKIQDEVTTMKSDLDKLRDDVTAVTSAIGKLRNDVTIQNTIDFKALATFTNDQRKLKDDIAALQATRGQGEVTAMKSDLDKLLDDVTATTSAIVKLREDVDFQNDTSRWQETALQLDSSALKKDLTELKTTLSKLDDEQRKLQGAIKYNCGVLQDDFKVMKASQCRLHDDVSTLKKEQVKLDLHVATVQCVQRELTPRQAIRGRQRIALSRPVSDIASSKLVPDIASSNPVPLKPKPGATTVKSSTAKSREHKVDSSKLKVPVSKPIKELFNAAGNVLQGKLEANITAADGQSKQSSVVSTTGDKLEQVITAAQTPRTSSRPSVSDELARLESEIEGLKLRQEEMEDNQTDVEHQLERLKIDEKIHDSNMFTMNLNLTRLKNDVEGIKENRPIPTVPFPQRRVGEVILIYFFNFIFISVVMLVFC